MSCTLCASRMALMVSLRDVILRFCSREAMEMKREELSSPESIFAQRINPG
jgi:hypothetical protein